MKKDNVTEQELNSALDYLNSFKKGEETDLIDGEDAKEPKKTEGEEDQELEDELYAAHKKKMASYVDKAMSHKSFMDKIKKGEPLPDEAFEGLDDDEGEETKKVQKPENDEGEGFEKGLKNQIGSRELDELIKARVDGALSEQKRETDKIIKGLQDKIANLEDQPIRKTLIKGADAITLQKAIAGEKIDNKTVLSVSLQKGKVSEALYSAWENETDEIQKGKLGDAVTQFESTGNFISIETADIMDKKGYKIIK